MSKVYDLAALSTAELKMELRLAALADGQITPDEQHLIDLADRAYAYTEATATCVRSGLRVLGGGRVDDRMARAVRESVGMIAAVAVPAQDGGSGSKKKGLTLVRKANGSTRLVGRG